MVYRGQPLLACEGLCRVPLKILAAVRKLEVTFAEIDTNRVLE